MTARLSIRGVAVSLGDREILHGVSCELQPGEVLGLVGPNGAGKTTLLRTIAGHVGAGRGERVEGEMELDGVSLRSTPRRELARRVAVVPQDTGVPFPYRVGELVLMGRSPHQSWLGLDGDGDVELALAALERVGIAELADRTLFEISGGERQLALFARAIVQEPRLLLLDEPTSFLDLQHRVRLLSVVRELAAEGASALIVSHDLGLAGRVCDRMVVLAEGRVRADGPPREVLRPELVREVYGVGAQVLETSDGGRVVVPDLVAPPR